MNSIWIWSLCISYRWQGTGVPGHLRWVSSSTARRWLSETARQECCEAPLMGIDVSAITKMSPAYTCIPVCFLAGANLQLSEEFSDQTPRSWISLWQALYTEALTPPLTGLAISRTLRPESVLDGPCFVLYYTRKDITIEFNSRIRSLWPG